MVDRIRDRANTYLYVRRDSKSSTYRFGRVLKPRFLYGDDIEFEFTQIIPRVLFVCTYCVNKILR